MTTKGFDVAHLDELEEVVALDGTLRWRPVRRHLDVGAFGVNAFAAPNAGDRVVEDHTERSKRHQEIYVVIRGRATFEIDGDEVDAPVGTLVFLREPEARRGALAAEPGTLVLALGAPAGEAYTPSEWEHWFLGYARADAGDLEGAVAELEEGLRAHPGHPALLYHLACLEARSGRADAALEHLETAVQADARFRDHARDDPDLAGVRGDPRFLAIAGEAEPGSQGA
jgi:tetratricopeptide (TPR) repeat protein